MTCDTCNKMRSWYRGHQEFKCPDCGAPIIGSEPNPKMMFADPVGPWHWHFAWLPVRTFDNRLAWLTWVRRRCMQKHEYLTGGPDFSWQYHLPTQPLRQA